jgi:hypothetical protein
MYYNRVPAVLLAIQQLADGYLFLRGFGCAVPPLAVGVDAAGGPAYGLAIVENWDEQAPR